jgi:hypothetical protein
MWLNPGDPGPALVLYPYRLGGRWLSRCMRADDRAVISHRVLREIAGPPADGFGRTLTRRPGAGPDDMTGAILHAELPHGALDYEVTGTCSHRGRWHLEKRGPGASP